MAPGNIMGASTHPNDLLVSLYSLTMAQWKNFTPTRKDITNPIKSDTAYVDIGEDPDLGVIPTQVTGAPSDILTTREGYLKQFRPVRYGGRIVIDADHLEDAQNDLPMQRVRGLNASLNETWEQLTYDAFFNNAFDVTLTSDLAFLYSETHSHYPGGPSVSNLGAAAVPNLTGIWAGINQWRKWTSAGGKKSGSVPQDIFCTIDQEQVVRETLESELYPAVGDDTNRKNIIRRFNLNVRVSPYITGTIWVLWNRGEHRWYTWDRRPARVSTDGDFATDNSFWKITGRHTCGPGTFAGCLGNAGAS